jgi:hypothetical protein
MQPVILGCCRVIQALLVSVGHEVQKTVFACVSLLSLIRRCACTAMCHVWNERCRSLLCTIPTFFLYQQLHVMFSAQIEYLPSMLPTARLRINLKRRSLRTPHRLHISPPGEKRRWRRRRPRDGRAIHHSSNLQSLLLHASTQVGRSVQLRLWGDCKCGRVVHIHLPVVLRGGLAGVRWTRRVERHQHTPEMYVWRSRD